MHRSAAALAADRRAAAAPQGVAGVEDAHREVAGGVVGLERHVGGGDAGGELDRVGVVAQEDGRVSQITYADGTALDLTQGLTFTWRASGTGLALSGSNDGANVFELAPGGDVVTGSGQTANTYVFGKGDGHGILNYVIIPILLHKAGLPEADSRGTITSHRARATLATKLYNGASGLGPLEVMSWLGHTHFSSTQHYLALTPVRLMTAFHKGAKLTENLRMVGVLVDSRPEPGQPVFRYNLGHGWCTVSGAPRPWSWRRDGQLLLAAAQHQGISSSMRACGQPFTRRVNRSAK